MPPHEERALGAGDHLPRNRAAWDSWATDYVKPGETAWAAGEPTWGIWSIPENEAHLLPDGLAGKDTVELGCGTACVSAWLARRWPCEEVWKASKHP
ncbi:MAG: hypothetical protein FJ000_06750 [Actinobacteria bacterium]|nr:hypothetical protein [Actinomycetota bacterium]